MALPMPVFPEWLSKNSPKSDRPELAAARRVLCPADAASVMVIKYRAVLEPLADKLGAALGASCGS
jgi:electron transfer flavoprotein alpha subunit